MDATGLYDAFRSDVVDTAKPYLWSDYEVWRYASDAYTMFVRKTGGIADVLSEACEVAVTLGDSSVVIHPSVMRIMSATKRSDHRPIDVINSTDVEKMRTTDYGQVKQLILDERAGQVRYLIIGQKRGVGRVVQVPLEDDIIDLEIYRLPLKTTLVAGDALDEVSEEHHIHLLNWMKHLAYLKQDAETFNPQASAFGEERFNNYCSQVKAEWARYMHKPRTVAYGGL